MALVAMTTADHIEYVSDLDNCKKREKKLIDVPEGADAQYKTEIIILAGATTFKLRSLDVFLMGHIWDSASVLRGVQGSEEVGIHTSSTRPISTPCATVWSGSPTSPTPRATPSGSRPRRRSSTAGPTTSLPTAS